MDLTAVQNELLLNPEDPQVLPGNISNQLCSSRNVFASLILLSLVQKAVQNGLVPFEVVHFIIPFDPSNFLRIAAVSHLLKIIKMMINLGNFMTKMIQNFTDLFIIDLLNGKVFDSLDQILGSFGQFGLSLGDEVLKWGLFFGGFSLV